MKLTFPLGFAFVLIGVAISCFVNYLDMRQFEARLNEFVSTNPASDASGIYQSLKSRDGFSIKYISPELSRILLDDFSRTDNYVKSDFQDIRNSVSKKKSDALHNMGCFLCLAAMMGIVNYSTILKAKN